MIRAIFTKIVQKILGPSEYFKFPDGINISHKDQLPLDQLLVCLKVVVQFLKSHSYSQRLLTYDDWQQHDGLHFPGKDIQFEELEQMILSSESLRKETPNDFMVYLGIAPEDMSWYLRIYTETIDEEGDNGFFDLSIAECLSEKLFSKLNTETKIKFLKTPSPAFYHEITR